MTLPSGTEHLDSGGEALGTVCATAVGVAIAATPPMVKLKVLPIDLLIAIADMPGRHQEILVSSGVTSEVLRTLAPPRSPMRANFIDEYGAWGITPHSGDVSSPHVEQDGLFSAGANAVLASSRDASARRLLIRLTALILDSFEDVRDIVRRAAGVRASELNRLIEAEFDVG